MEMLQSFKKCVTTTVPLMVVKYNKLASIGETLETKLAADVYISASLESDSFLTYRQFSVSSLQKAGFSLSDAQAMSIDKYKIPHDRRELVIRYERIKVIDDYVETNEYYRKLNGLPPLDDDTFLYLPEEYYTKYDIPTNTPIHKISRNSLVILEIDGILGALYTETKKDYIKYLGERRVDIVSARLADNFSLIYFPKNGIDTFYRDFIMTYDECREYFLSVIYNRNLSNMHENYDEFIGFSILTMTIQRLITTIFKVIVDRDFYDVDTIRLFLESYNVPFIRSLPMTQLKVLTHNLNILISNKSNNVVLFDIIDILGYDNFELMKCYLFKQHKLDDETGNPIFKYKTEVDQDGNEYLVEDKEKMYELFFKSINVLEEDIQSALESVVDTEEYDRFIVGDSTWINDDELKQKIYDTDFNYVDTKYMSVNIAYKMHKMLFEIVYVFKAIADNKSQTSKIFLGLPKISTQPISLFDCILSLIVLTCDRQRLESTIMKDPSKILAVLGFNFDLDLEKIKEDIMTNSKLDDELCKYLVKIQFTTPDDVNSMYENIKDLEDLIVTRMNETNEIHTYQLYDELYQTLLTTTVHNELFKLPTGEVANTYADYLNYKNPTLFNYIEGLKEENIGESIDYIVDKLMDALTSTYYMKYMNSLDSYMAEGILKLLRFFKSYTIDIRELDIIYLMNSRYYNMIRVMGQFEKTMTGLTAIDKSIDMSYNDMVNIMKVAINDKDTMDLVDFMITNYNQLTSDLIETREHINSTQDVLVSSQVISSIYADLIRLSETISHYDKSINLSSLISTTESINDNSIIITSDKLNDISNVINMTDRIIPYDLFNLNNYPMFTKPLSKRHYTDLLNQSKTRVDINDLYILLHNTLTDVLDSKYIDIIKPLIYRLNYNLKDMNTLSLSESTIKYDKIVMHKVIVFLNKLIHLLSDMKLDITMDINKLRVDTIYSTEYNLIYDDIKSCSRDIRDLIYTILNIFIEVLETLPNQLTVSQLLIILGTITKDVTSISHITLTLSKDDTAYIETKLKYIYGGLNYLITNIGKYELISMIEYYLSLDINKPHLMKDKYKNIDHIIIDKLCMFMDHNRFSIKDIIRLMSCESIFNHILSQCIDNNLKVNDIVGVDHIIELVKIFKKSLINSSTILSTIYDEHEIHNSILFTTTANIVLDQIEYYMNDKLQTGLTQTNISTMLNLLQTCINSLVLGYNTFIDNNIEGLATLTLDNDYNNRQAKLTKLKELTKELKCGINPKDEITFRETIEFIRH